MVNSSLVNLGISCFIKAGLEAMLATPTLREELLQGASGMEMALSELCHNLQTSEQPLKPTKSTDKFYREDDRRTWPSLLVRLLDNCPSLAEFLVERKCRCCDAYTAATDNVSPRHKSS